MLASARRVGDIEISNQRGALGLCIENIRLAVAKGVPTEVRPMRERGSVVIAGEDCGRLMSRGFDAHVPLRMGTTPARCRSSGDRVNQPRARAVRFAVGAERGEARRGRDASGSTCEASAGVVAGKQVSPVRGASTWVSLPLSSFLSARQDCPACRITGCVSCLHAGGGAGRGGDSRCSV
jgi:hypothetical protein